MPENRTVIFGVGIDRLTEDETVERFLALSDQGMLDRRPCRIAVTVNVDFFINTFRVWSAHAINAPLLDVMRNSPLVVADGMPVVLLSRLLGESLPERVAGSDLLERIIAKCAAGGKKVYFIGGDEISTNAAAEIFRQKYPDLQISGIDTSFIKMDDSPETCQRHVDICRRIVESGTAVLLVGLGNPKQELWAARNAELLPGIVSIGIGGSFNFISGRVKRAPRWMQKSGLEWIYRIIQEPKRLFKRYAIGLVKYNAMSGLLLSVVWPGKLLACLGGGNRDFLLVGPDEDCRLDCRKMRVADNAALLHILRIYRECAAGGKRLELINCSPFVRLQLAVSRMTFPACAHR